MSRYILVKYKGAKPERISRFGEVGPGDHITVTRQEWVGIVEDPAFEKVGDTDVDFVWKAGEPDPREGVVEVENPLAEPGPEAEPTLAELSADTATADTSAEEDGGEYGLDDDVLVQDEAAEDELTYDDWTVAELKEEMGNRELVVSAKAVKADLVAALYADDDPEV